MRLDDNALNMNRWPWLLRIVAFTAVYFIAGKLGLSLAFFHASATPVWPCTGLALTALLLVGYRFWPGVWLGAFLVNLSTYGTVLTSASIATGNTLEALLGAYLINRFANGRCVFDRAADTFKFILLAGAASTALSATIGVTTLASAGLAEWAQYGSIWLTWWVGNMVSNLLIGSSLIMWSERVESPVRFRPVEMAALFSVIWLVGFGVFIRVPPSGYPYLTLLPLIWATFRFGRQTAALACLLLSGIAIYGTLQGLGPFSTRDPNYSLIMLQGFIGVAAAMLLLLSSAMYERAETEAILRADIEKRQQAKERLSRKNQALVKLARHGYAGGDLTEAFHAITSISAKTLDVARVGIWLFTRDRAAIRCADLYEQPRDRHADGMELAAADYPAYFQALEQERTITAHDAATDPRTAEFLSSYLQPHGISSMLDAPIRRHGEVVGVICHEHVGLSRHWTPEAEQFVGSVADIVALALESEERRQAEEQLKASLKEKEVLLKEIHHRVKNNLQIISSLLSLQAEEIRDPAALEKFRDSQARIQSMALVHEKLYQSKDLGKIDMGAYIASLAQTLVHAQGGGQQNARIRLQVEAEEQYVTLDTAIPCGLILNELLSNALKHAFPGGRAGRIAIRFRKAAEDRFTLTVEDDGEGLPEQFDLQQSPSLGLRIVHALTDQLDGQLRMQHNGGASFGLTFREVPRSRQHV